MQKHVEFVAGIGTGAALMYLMDPDRGKRRRAMVRDQAVHAFHQAEDAVETTARDLRNRAQGVVAEARAKLQADDASESVLIARVRSELGRVCSHPSAISAAASAGVITLSGDVLASEVERIFDAVKGVRGVERVENDLQTHSSADGVPALQGGRSRPGERFELLQENWSPATRLLAGLAGGGAALYAARRRDALGGLVGAAGMALLTRSLGNRPVSELTPMADPP